MLRRLFPLRAGTVLALLLLTTWAAFRVTAAEPTAVPSPVTIAPEPLGLKTARRSARRALVLRPPSVKGLRSWTIETRRHRGYISTFAVSPDGKSLATGGLDGIVRVWDVGTGRFVRALVGHDSYVYGLAYSPDGNTLASAGSYDATVRLWDTPHGQPLRVLRHKSYVVHVAWAPDGRTLASAGGESGFVTFWDAPSGRELRILEYGRYVYALAWSPDGKTLAAGGLQVSAQLWDAEEGKSLAKIEQDGGDVYTLAWAPDGKSLATAGKTNSVLWQIDGGKSKALQRLPDSARALAWAPDGKTLAAELPTGAVQLWDVQTNKVLKPIGTSANLLRWLPDGSALVCGSSLALTLWDTSPKLLRTIEVGTLAPLTWRPGKPLVSGVGTAQLSIWETATCKPLHPLPAFPAGVAGVDWSPGGKTLACACSDGKVRLIEAATGKVDPALEGHKGPVAALAWSPSGKTLASASADKTVRLWTPGSTKPPRVLEGHEDAVNLLAWAPGGATLASGSADGTVRLWRRRHRQDHTHPPRSAGRRFRGLVAQWPLHRRRLQRRSGLRLYPRRQAAAYVRAGRLAAQRHRPGLVVRQQHPGGRPR